MRSKHESRAVAALGSKLFHHKPQSYLMSMRNGRIAQGGARQRLTRPRTDHFTGFVLALELELAKRPKWHMVSLRLLSPYQLALVIALPFCTCYRPTS